MLEIAALVLGIFLESSMPRAKFIHCIFVSNRDPMTKAILRKIMQNESGHFFASQPTLRLAGLIQP